MEKELDYTALGIRIRQARKEHHVTQEQLGELCELSTAHIGHIERGTRIPSIDTSQGIIFIAICCNFKIFLKFRQSRCNLTKFAV